MDIGAVSDRLEINDLLTRYATAVDRRDWDLYRSVFTPDAHIDYTSAGGRAGSVDEITKWLEETLAVFKATQHMVANPAIELDENTATVTAMFFNPIEMPDGSVFTTGGWYHHRLVRTSDGWRSRALREESSWFQGLPRDTTSPEQT